MNPLNHFTDTARNAVLNVAPSIAQQLGSSLVRSDDLMLALLNDEKSHCRAVLEEMGVGIPGLILKVREMQRARVATVPTT
jgi:ATP-dependent Clp protease ATP-binding subunit ClpA